jgi:hypothetical protein
VSERVDAEGSVVEERCADAESPGEHLKRAGSKLRVVRLKEVAEPCHAKAEKNRWHDVVSLKEAKLRKLNEVLYELPTGLNELRAQNPSDMRPPHTVDAWWMNVFLGVRELMVMAVVRCPPDRPLLSGGCADEREYELEPPTRLVASVREVSVIYASDAEHTDCVECHAHGESYPAKARPDNQEASEVNSPEGPLLDEVNGMERITAGIHVLEISPGARSFSRSIVHR